MTDVWAEYQQRRAEHGFDPEAVAAAGANDERLGAKVVQGGLGGLRGAVGTPSRCASTCAGTRSAVSTR